jgi:hypothetical protein
MSKQIVMGCHVHDPLFFNSFYPTTLKECILLIFQLLWVIQMGMSALSTHENFIFRPYVERRHFEWEGGDWDTKCSVTDLFTLMNFLLCDFWWMWLFPISTFVWEKKPYLNWTEGVPFSLSSDGQWSNTTPKKPSSPPHPFFFKFLAKL